MKTPALLSSFLFLLFASSALADEPESADSQDVRLQTAVSFLPSNRSEKADLYFPRNPPAGLLPAVVVIHGGGWVGGRRDAKREINIGTTLARNGFAVMSIDYLLSVNQRAVWPTNLWDCKNAVRWLRQNAGRLSIDPQRIGVLGGSAGGHLAAMVALTSGVASLEPPGPAGEFPSAVKCCVDFYGISDIGTYHDVTMLGKTFREDPEAYRLASPVTYVRSNSPPFLILHGTSDETVHPRQSQLLAGRLQDARVPCELILVEGAPHSFDLEPKQRDLKPVVLNFLKKHLAEPR